MSKLLVIGLDGATFDLLQPWVDDGTLPTFARLLAQGSYGRVRSVPNTDTAPAWATFATGLNPANHGLFGELSWDDERRLLRPVRGADRHGRAFWQLASQAGRRVLVVNVPFTYPAEPVNGVLVTGIDAPGENDPHFCYPPDARAGLDGYQIDSDIQAAIKENRPQTGLVDAYRVEQRRTELLCQLMAGPDWDLAVIVYSVPDVMQHFFWQSMCSRSGPQREAIREGYRFADEQIRCLLTAAGEGVNVLIMSDHGFGPICATPAFLTAWLVEQGFIQVLTPKEKSLKQRLVSRAYTILRQQLSEAQKDSLRRRLPGLRNRVESQARFANVDWRQTRVYVGASYWEVWVNRMGREPHGIVAAGPEYEQLCTEVKRALLAWEDEATGQKRIRQVYRADEVYHGRFQHLAPDLTLEWNPDAAPPAATLPGNISRFDGDHQPEGILIMVGPDVRSQTAVTGATLADLAPTILRLLDVPVPDELDGRVLSEIML